MEIIVRLYEALIMVTLSIGAIERIITDSIHAWNERGLGRRLELEGYFKIELYVYV